MNDNRPPTRHLKLELTLEADNLAELCQSLEQIALDLEGDGREERNVTSGGWSSGWTYLLHCDPTMDGDRYRDALLEWRRRNREAKASQ